MDDVYRNQQPTGTERLTNAIRLHDEESELTALDVLNEISGGSLECDLTSDPTTNETILVMPKDAFATLSRRLNDLGILFDEVPVKRMSDLPPEVCNFVRWLGR